MRRKRLPPVCPDNGAAETSLHEIGASTSFTNNILQVRRPVLHNSRHQFEFNSNKGLLSSTALSGIGPAFLNVERDHKSNNISFLLPSAKRKKAAARLQQQKLEKRTERHVSPPSSRAVHLHSLPLVSSNDSRRFWRPSLRRVLTICCVAFLLFNYFDNGKV